MVVQEGQNVACGRTIQIATCSSSLLISLIFQPFPLLRTFEIGQLTRTCNRQKDMQALNSGRFENHHEIDAYCMCVLRPSRGPGVNASIDTHTSTTIAQTPRHTYAPNSDYGF